MSRPVIAGSAMTRMGKHLTRSVKDLTAEAVAVALQDAGFGPGRIEAAFFANTRQPMLEGQNTVRGQIALRAAGVHGVPIVNVENACASGSTAVMLAATAIRAGLYEVVLAVGAEKMVFPDKPDAMQAAFRGGTDIETIERAHGDVMRWGMAMAPEAAQDDVATTRSFFMDSYAGQARLHMERFGTTQRQMAAAAAKNHDHSAHNPMSQYRTPMTVDEVLADKPIVWPFTRSMCAPMSDGAAAIVLCAPSALMDRSRAIVVRAVELVSASPRGPRNFESHIGACAARRAYEAAAIGPDDVDVAEVHDATAYAEIQQIENLGFCRPGEGGPYTESGATRLGGRIPVNPSGGLVSKGHPVGATGLAQIHELCLHLRGEAGARQVENARIAAAENGGGFLDVEEAATVVTILERPSA